MGIAISRGRLTFAGLAAGAGQGKGCRAAWFRAGHEAAVDLALLTDRASGSWEMGSGEDRPLPGEHMALRSPLRWEREGAAEWCGQGPASPEEGSSVPSHSLSGPWSGILLRRLRRCHTLSLRGLSRPFSDGGPSLPSGLQVGESSGRLSC